VAELFPVSGGFAAAQEITAIASNTGKGLFQNFAIDLFVINQPWYESFSI
jgi:hypothetical protein